MGDMPKYRQMLHEIKEALEQRDALEQELGSIRATLVVNFGKDGRKLCGVEVEHERLSTHGFMVEVLELLSAAPMHTALKKLAERWRYNAKCRDPGLSEYDSTIAALNACSRELEMTLAEPHMQHVVCNTPTVTLDTTGAQDVTVRNSWNTHRTFEHELLFGHSAGKPFSCFDECVPEEVKIEVGSRIKGGYYKQ